MHTYLKNHSSHRDDSVMTQHSIHTAIKASSFVWRLRALSLLLISLSLETSVIAAEGGFGLVRNCVNVSQDFALTPFRVIATRTPQKTETPS